MTNTKCTASSDRFLINLCWSFLESKFSICLHCGVVTRNWVDLKTVFNKIIPGCVIDELMFGIPRLLIFLGMNFTICEYVPPRTLTQSIYLTTFTKIFGRVKYFMLIPDVSDYLWACLIVWLLSKWKYSLLSQRAACLRKLRRALVTTKNKYHQPERHKSQQESIPGYKAKRARVENARV